MPTYEKFRRYCRGLVAAMASVYFVCVWWQLGLCLCSLTVGLAVSYWPSLVYSPRHWDMGFKCKSESFQLRFSPVFLSPLLISRHPFLLHNVCVCVCVCVWARSYGRVCVQTRERLCRCVTVYWLWMRLIFKYFGKVVLYAENGREVGRRIAAYFYYCSLVVTDSRQWLQKCQR